MKPTTFKSEKMKTCFLAVNVQRKESKYRVYVYACVRLVSDSLITIYIQRAPVIEFSDQR